MHKFVTEIFLKNCKLQKKRREFGRNQYRNFISKEDKRVLKTIIVMQIIVKKIIVTRKDKF